MPSIQRYVEEAIVNISEAFSQEVVFFLRNLLLVFTSLEDFLCTEILLSYEQFHVANWHRMMRHETYSSHFKAIVDDLLYQL